LKAVLVKIHATRKRMYLLKSRVAPTFETSGTTYPARRCHVPSHNGLPSCERLKTRTCV